MDVRGWLERLGLGQYADAFVANHIDGGLLRGLTTDDLRELGVASLGHRKRLLEAIVGLEEAGPAAAPEAERRQVAVLFADLCSFTELSSALGAEEMRRIVDHFLARADELIVEHGGSVDKHIGDATMAVFGAPLSHEDDPLRAVAAADAIQRAMPALSADLGRPATAPLLSHVGIALGEVVAGEIGGSVRRDYTVLGETVNLASRIVGEAKPGEIVLDDATWRAVSNRVRAAPLGGRSLKGIAAPQRLWRFEGLREATTAGRLPFVGREIELAQISAVLSASQSGALLHLRGEAGIGKSRLLAEALLGAVDRGFVSFQVRVLDFGAGRRQTPLRLLAETLIAARPAWIDDPRRRFRPARGPARRAGARHAGGARNALRRHAGRAAGGVPRRSSGRSRGRRRRGHAACDRRRRPALGRRFTLRAFVRAAARLAVSRPLVLMTTSRPEGDPVDAAFRRDLGGASVVMVELGPFVPMPCSGSHRPPQVRSTRRWSSASWRARVAIRCSSSSWR